MVDLSNPGELFERLFQVAGGGCEAIFYTFYRCLGCGSVVLGAGLDDHYAWHCQLRELETK